MKPMDLGWCDGSVHQSVFLFGTFDQPQKRVDQCQPTDTFKECTKLPRESKLADSGTSASLHFAVRAYAAFSGSVDWSTRSWG
mmetsp:Transcript_2162/g.5759  ORF Transcript_2162/g.5759 Transcript_2162/m.5759 type:complete len:83 (+) Transcript_2162:60-308(+)